MFMVEIPAKFRAPEPESEFDRQMMAQIHKVGWYNLHVAEENGSPEFAFTIGHFENRSHPELIIIGLRPGTAEQFLNLAADRITSANEKIIPYKKYNDLADGVTVAFVPVAYKYYDEYLGYANWYYDSMPKPFPALQLVWPDRAGRFPWEDGYDQRILKLQPLLGAMP